MEKRRTQGAIEGISLAKKVELFSYLEGRVSFDEFSKIISEPNYVRQKSPEFIDLGISEAYKVTSETEDVKFLREKWEKDVAVRGYQETGVLPDFYCEELSLFSDEHMSTYLLKQKKEKLPCALIGLTRGRDFYLRCYAPARMLWDVKTLICSRLLYLYVIYNPGTFAVIEVASAKPEKVYNVVFGRINQLLEESPDSLKQAFLDLAPRDELRNRNLNGFPDEVKTGKFYMSKWTFQDFSLKFPTFQDVIERISSLLE